MRGSWSHRKLEMWTSHEDPDVLSWYTVYGMDLNCVQLLVIACVFSIDMFNISSTLFHPSESLHGTSVSTPLFIRPCVQSSGQTAVRPAQAPGQSRWVVQTNHGCSPMLWLAGVPAALTPSSFFCALSLCHTFLWFLFLSSFPPISSKSFPFPWARLLCHRHPFPLKCFPFSFLSSLLDFLSISVSFFTHHLTSLPVCLRYSRMAQSKTWPQDSVVHLLICLWLPQCVRAGPAGFVEMSARFHSPPDNTLKLCVCFHRDSQALPRTLDKQTLSCGVTRDVVRDSSFSEPNQIWIWNMLLSWHHSLAILMQ